MIGHISTETMQMKAAVHIDRKIGGTDAEMPEPEPPKASEQPTLKTAQKPKFEPYSGKIRKPGTDFVTMINDHLYEGRDTPINAYGKRESHNIYAKTREECEEKLAVLIVEMKAEIKAEKEIRKVQKRRRADQWSALNMSEYHMVNYS